MESSNNLKMSSSELIPQQPTFMSSFKIPLLLILGLAILTAVLCLILGLSLGRKKNKLSPIHILPNSTDFDDDSTDVSIDNSTDPDTEIEPVKILSWPEANQKSEEFISKLNLTERINLLFGTENMKMETLLIKEEELVHTCVGQIDPFKNKKRSSYILVLVKLIHSKIKMLILKECVFKMVQLVFVLLKVQVFHGKDH